uniref:Uncharacterized protein n=1 Tax=Arundo donax TaxID=35708 RepID=A0A0A8Y909_ARUDO
MLGCRKAERNANLVLYMYVLLVGGCTKQPRQTQTH